MYGNKSVFRRATVHLVEWCRNNQLSYNVNKTKELTVDFRKRKSGDQMPIFIGGSVMERVSSFHSWVLLSWAKYIDGITANMQVPQLYDEFKEICISLNALIKFYRYTFERILIRCILA